MDDDDLCDWPELVRRAGSPGRARGWLARGDWWRVVHGVHAPIGLVDGPALRARALRRALPPHAALSHRTALWLLGLDALGQGLDVTVPRGHRLQPRPGVRVHSAALPDHDLCDVDGLLVVSAARAVVDVARREPLIEGIALGDAVLRGGLASREQVEAAVAAASGLRGVLRARQAAGLVDGRSESRMESRLRVPFVQAGLEVECQVDLYDGPSHVARLDLVVEGVGVEFDGREVHLAEAAFVHERRRQARLLEAGLELRRFTAADVYGRTASDLCAEVLRAARLARSRPAVRLQRGPDTLRPPRRQPLPTRADTRRAA